MKMKKFSNIIVGISAFVVFLAAVGCANPAASNGSGEISSGDAALMGNSELSSAVTVSGGVLTITEDIKLAGNPGDFAEWKISMSQAEKASVKWYTTGSSTKFNVMVNGTVQGGKKTFSTGSGSRSLELPAGAVTIRMQIADSDSAGGEITFTKVEVKSEYASAESTSSSSVSSSSSSTASSEPSSSSSSSAATGKLLPQDGNPVNGRYDNYLDWDATKTQADIILSYQYNNGGYPKNQSYDSAGSGGDGKGTIDNGATTTETTYMAHVYHKLGDSKYRTSARKGFDFLFEMQYDNGGFPQFYPLKGGYADHVTYNDDAMSRVMVLLDKANKKEYPFDGTILTSAQRAKLQDAIDRGVDYILKSQWKQNGKLTVWCAQHGKDDYLPKKARAYELESLSGSESEEIIGFLMTQPQTPEIKKAVDAALAWYRSPDTILEDYTYDKSTEEKIVYKEGSRMWYRFYDLETNQGFFSDRDGGKYYDIMEISEERRNGYSWGGNYGSKIIKYADSVGY